MQTHGTRIVLSACLLLAFPITRRASAAESTLKNPAGLVTIQQIDSALDMPMPELDLAGEVPLSDVVNIIESQMKEVSSLPIKFTQNYLELELESIDSLSDLLVRDVFFHDGSHTFRQALDLIFEETDPKLEYLPQHGHILLTTKAKTSETYTIQVYDVSAVIEAIIHNNKRVAGRTYIRTQLGSGQQHSVPKKRGAAFEIAELIIAATSPPAQWIDVDGEGGVIMIAGNRLTVTQTYEVHRLIKQLLADLAEPLSISAKQPNIAANELREANVESPYLLISFAIAGWVVAFFLAIVVVAANRPRNTISG